MNRYEYTINGKQVFLNSAKEPNIDEVLKRYEQKTGQRASGAIALNSVNGERHRPKPQSPQTYSANKMPTESERADIQKQYEEWEKKVDPPIWDITTDVIGAAGALKFAGKQGAKLLTKGATKLSPALGKVAASKPVQFILPTAIESVGAGGMDYARNRAGHEMSHEEALNRAKGTALTYGAIDMFLKGGAAGFKNYFDNKRLAHKVGISPDLYERGRQGGIRTPSVSEKQAYYNLSQKASEGLNRELNNAGMAVDTAAKSLDNSKIIPRPELAQAIKDIARKEAVASRGNMTNTEMLDIAKRVAKGVTDRELHPIKRRLQTGLGSFEAGRAVSQELVPKYADYAKANARYSNLVDPQKSGKIFKALTNPTKSDMTLKNTHKTGLGYQNAIRDIEKNMPVSDRFLDRSLDLAVDYAFDNPSGSNLTSAVMNPKRGLTNILNFTSEPRFHRTAINVTKSPIGKIMNRGLNAARDWAEWRVAREMGNLDY